MGRGVCSEAGCGRRVAGRGSCWHLYTRWRAEAHEDELRPPAGTLRTADVAAALAISVGPVYNLITDGRLQPDGRAGGRSWWWPGTVGNYQATRIPSGTVSTEEVAHLLGLPLRKVYRLAGLRPVGRYSNQPRWAPQEVLAYRQRLAPDDAVYASELAQLLEVTANWVRRLAGSTLPADGRDPSGRLPGSRNC